MAYGSSEARGQVGAAALGLYHRHRNAEFKPVLTHTTAHGNAGSLTHWTRPGMESAGATTGTPQNFSLNFFFFFFLAAHSQHM